jgi:hypothetical protein
MVRNPDGLGESTDGLETPLLCGQPAPFVSAFVAAVDEAMRAPQPHGGLSTLPQRWLALCITAVVVTHSSGWARFARASRGTSALAALSWLLRHSTLPWDALLVASGRVMRRYHGLTSGHRMMDDTDNARSNAAQALAHLSKWRDQDSGGYVWGQSLVLLVLVPPTISRPVGLVFSQPAPALRAWSQQAKVRKKPGIPPTQRPPKPTPEAQYPTKQQLALRLLAACKAYHPAIRVHGMAAAALDGTRALVEEASVLCEGVPVLSPIRRTQHLRVGQRHQPVADSCATPPGTPPTIRIRAGAGRVAMVGSARLDVCAHTTKRFIVAITYAEAETYRSLIASDLRWRTLDMVQGHSLRWLGEVFMQDGQAYAGWSPLTKQPGDEGARHSVLLSLLVDHSLCMPPDQQAQLQHNRAAYTVGSLRAHVPAECLMNVIDDLVSADHPQDQLQRFTKALHEVCALGQSAKQMIQRPWGRLEPTPSLKYRAYEAMRHIPVMST